MLIHVLLRRLQGHLTKNLGFVAEEDAAISKLQTTAENSVGIHKQLVIGTNNVL